MANDAIDALLQRCCFCSRDDLRQIANAVAHKGAGVDDEGLAHVYRKIGEAIFVIEQARFLATLSVEQQMQILACAWERGTFDA